VKLNMYEAKTRLSQLVDQVAAGEEVVIARNGRPVARLVPAETRPATREPGSLRGKIWLAPDFDQTDPELVDVMENGPVFPGWSR
jgi:prevent-host-death family protein